MATAEALKMYSLPLDSKGHITGQINPRLNSEEAGRQLDRQAKRYAVQHRCSYAEALREVMGDPDNETLVAAYSAVTPSIDDGLTDAAVEADKRTRKHMEQFGVNYQKAVRHVLDSDPDLKNAYSRTFQV